MFTWISLKIVSLKALIGLDFIFQSYLLLDLIKKVIEDSALPANLLTTVCVLVNLFNNSSFHYWLRTHYSQIPDAFSNCYLSPNKNLQLAYSTLLLNYEVLLTEKKDQEGQAQVLSAALQVRCLES